jgi:3',5'-cyclic AMP phosphodiesterase CpdA
MNVPQAGPSALDSSGGFIEVMDEVLAEPCTQEQVLLYTRGEPPTWSLVHKGHTAHREAATKGLRALEADGRAALLLEGAGGEGKTTAMMQIGLGLRERGYRVLFAPSPPRDVIAELGRPNGPVALLIDQADQLHDAGALFQFAKERGAHTKIVLAARSPEWKPAEGLVERVALGLLTRAEASAIAEKLIDAGAAKADARGALASRIYDESRGFLLAAILIATHKKPLTAILRSAVRNVSARPEGDDLLRALGVVVALEGRVDAQGEHPFFCGRRLFEEALGVPPQEADQRRRKLVGELHLERVGDKRVTTRNPVIAEALLEVLFNGPAPFLDEPDVLERILRAAERIAPDDPDARKLLGLLPTIYPPKRASLLGDSPGGAPKAAEPRGPSRLDMPDAQPKEPEQQSLFSWIHLTDIHFGHGAPAHRWDQKLVLRALRADIAAARGEGIPAPDTLLVTGDIAFSGAEAQYKDATAWLLDVASAAGLDASRVFLVPGNHDVDRGVDKERDVARLLRALREGSDELDTALADASDREKLARRMLAYFTFAERFAPVCLAPAAPPLAERLLGFSHRLDARGGLAVRLLGLNSALLSAGDDDQGKLRVGNEALNRAIESIKPGELVFILSHHPIRNAWLADQSAIASWLKANAHVHLSGHVHEADTEEARSGGGKHFVFVTSGAAHGERNKDPTTPTGHGYSFGAIVSGARDGELLLRVWPRRFSDKNKDFRADLDNIPRGATFAEHPVRLAR